MAGADVARPLKTSKKSPRGEMREEITDEMLPCEARDVRRLKLSDALTHAQPSHDHLCSPALGRSLYVQVRSNPPNPTQPTVSHAMKS